MDNHKFATVVALCQGRQPGLTPSEIDGFIFEGRGDLEQYYPGRNEKAPTFFDSHDAHEITDWVIQSEFWERLEE